MATITSTELIAANGYVNLGQPDVLNNLVARTYMVYMRPTGVQNPGYLFSKADNAGVGGPRVQISATNMGLSLVTPTSASNLTPNRSAVNSSLAYNDWGNFAFTWDGVTACNTQAKHYKDGAETTYGTSSTGSSPYLTGAGYDFRLFNRGGLDRACYGSFAYMAVWNRELSAAEIAQAYADGPLSIPSGLVLCWANGQDYGPNALTPTARSTFAEGVLPPNTNLGTSEPLGPVTGSMAVQESTVDVFAATAGNVSADMILVTTQEDTLNVHPTNSSITNPSTTTPTVNIHVRVIYSNWRQLCAKFTGVNGRRPLFRIINPDDCVSGFNSNWRPWYSYDKINWLRFDTAPVNATTTWNFQHSVAFAQDTVYIGYQPSWPVSRVPWLISELIGIGPSFVHELPSAPSYEYPTTMTDQVDELSNTIPGQKMYAFGIWDDALSPDNGGPKRIIIISGGMHAGEHVGSWAMEGFLRFLFSGHAHATTLLKNFKFHIYPMVNPMGRFMGHYRGQRNPGYFSLDPNRDWPVDNSASNLQSTQFVRDMLSTDMGTNRAAFALDFHATWGSSGAFFYHDGDALYKNYMDEALEVVGDMYDSKPSTVIPDTTMSGGVYRLCGNPLHCYTPEIYETSPFAGGTSDLFLIGEHFAKAIAVISNIKIETFRLPSNLFQLNSAKIEDGIRWNWYIASIIVPNNALYVGDSDYLKIGTDYLIIGE